VTIQGGTAGNTTSFQPGIEGPTTLAVSVPATPAGFATPALTYRQLPVSVTTSQIVLTAHEIAIGKDLQYEGLVILNQAAPAGGLPVTLTSNSAQLRLAATPSAVGQNSIQITVPAGSTNAPYYVHSLAASGTATYTATASGYGNGNASVALTPSGVVVSDTSGLPFLTIFSGSSTATVRVNMAQLKSSDSSYESTQVLRGGLSLNVTLNSANPAIATVDSPVTITGGAAPAGITTTVRRAGVGSTVISVTQPPGYTAATNLIGAQKPMPTMQINVQ
jgi:hypothetical protein